MAEFQKFVYFFGHFKKAYILRGNNAHGVMVPIPISHHYMIMFITIAVVLSCETQSGINLLGSSERVLIR